MTLLAIEADTQHALTVLRALQSHCGWNRPRTLAPSDPFRASVRWTYSRHLDFRFRQLTQALLILLIRALSSALDGDCASTAPVDGVGEAIPEWCCRSSAT